MSASPDIHEQAFQRLEGEWNALMSSPATWETILHQMVEEQSTLVADRKWVSGPSDLLSVIGKARKETYHSAVIAWLMRPNAHHGLDTAFLQRVVEHCIPGANLSCEVLRQCTTATEVVYPSSRADIVIQAPDWTLVIEVKVDALEQPAQCQRLMADHPNAAWCFLTPKGVAPTTAGDRKDEWVKLTFPALTSFLAESLAERASGEATPTVESYLKTLEGEFPT